MRLHYIIFTILFLCTSLGYSQVDTAALKTQFDKYTNAVKNKDYRQATGYMPASYFDFYNKEQWIKEMKQAMESPDTEITIHQSQINNIAAAVLDSGSYYVPFDYTQNFDIEYLNLFSPADDEDSRATTIKFIEGMMKESIPEAVITYNKSKEAFEVSSKKNALAIYNQESNDWKFLVLEPSLKNIWTNVVPAPVLKKINYEK